MHRSRWLAPVGLALLVLSGAAAASARPPRAPAASTARNTAISTARYRSPLSAALVVVHPFRAPRNPYGAGKRGVHLLAAPGTPVLAAGNGTVQFAGPVAGRGIVVIAHPDGLSTEYEPVDPEVSVGQPVTAGQRIGVIAAVQADCAPAGCLHWGARRGRQYLDPLSLLNPLGEVRLLPWP